MAWGSRSGVLFTWTHLGRSYNHGELQQIPQEIIPVIIIFYRKYKDIIAPVGWVVNDIDPDQTPRSTTSDKGLHYFSWLFVPVFRVNRMSWFVSFFDIYTCMYKKKIRVQGVPQSQTAALPRPQEEEETDKSKQAQTEQTYEKH